MADWRTQTVAPPTSVVVEEEVSPSSGDWRSQAVATPEPATDWRTTTTPVEATSTEPDYPSIYTRVREVISRPVLDAKLVGTEMTSDQELEAVAHAHGVSADELKKDAPFFGVRTARTDTEEKLEYIQGTAGRTAGGIPQFISKKMHESEEYRRALDDIRELGDRRRSWAEFVAENIPSGGTSLVAKKLVPRLLVGAGTGAGFGLGTSEEGREAESVAAGAVFGTAGSAGSHYVQQWLGRRTARRAAGEAAVRESRATETAKKIQDLRAEKLEQPDVHLVRSAVSDEILPGQIPTEDLARYVEENPSDVARLLGTTSDEVQEIHPTSLVEARGPELQAKIAGERIQSLAEDYSGRKFSSPEAAQQYLRSRAQDLGQRYVQEGLEDTLRVRKLQRRLQLEDTGRAGGGAGRVVVETGSDPKFVLRSLDEKYGTSLEPIHNKWNRAYNQYTYVKQGVEKELGTLFQEAGGKLQPEQLSRVYHALDTGVVAELQPDERFVYSGLRNFFRTNLERARNLASQTTDTTPLPIQSRENYVPHMSLEPVDFIRALEKKRDQVLSEVGVRRISDIPPEKMSLQSVRDLQRGLSYLDPESAATPEKMQVRFREMTDPTRGHQKLELAANALEARKGEIPEYLREKNPFRLADRWARNTYRYAYLRGEGDKLLRQARALRGAGDEMGAGYVERLVSDIAGVRPNTLAGFGSQMSNKWRLSMRRAADALPPDSIRGNLLRGAELLPDTLSFLNHNIYQNLLGLNPKSLIQNSLQTLLKTAPEVGGPYGYSLAARASLASSLDLPRLTRRMVDEGLGPADFTTANMDHMAQGILSSSTARIPARLLSGLTKASMYAYTKMDSANRILSLSMAENMASDLLRGSRGAVESLAKFPRSIRTQAQEFLAAGDEAGLSRALAEHLVSSTQYNYNRLSMSEFGRVMGPVFSTFSKWPTATAGEILGELRDKAAGKSLPRLAEKYLYPLILISGMGYLLHGDTEDMSDVQKKLYGARGLSSAAPVRSLEGILRGDNFSPPVISALVDGFVVPTLEGDEDKLVRGLGVALQNFAPGSVLARFLLDDMVTYSTGRRPEGSNFLERLEEGSRFYTK